MLGSSGAGKTHLSRRLAEVLGLACIHLDEHFWLPGQVPRGDREWRATVSRLVQRESWIMDGTYERSLDLRLPRADALVLLDCPRTRCLERVLRREGARGAVDPDHLRYVWNYPRATRPVVLASIALYARGVPVAVVDGPESAAGLLSQLQREPAPAAPDRAVAA